MFFLLNAKGEVEPISWIVTTISGVFAGVYFPVSQLPSQLQLISRALPQTYGLEGIRKIIFDGYGIDNFEIQMILLYLLIFILILFPLGFYIFKYGIKKAEKEGTLARWA